MFEKRDDVICCFAIGGTRRPGIAAERPNITQSAPARAVVDGDLRRSPWTDSEVPSDRRARTA